MTLAVLALRAGGDRSPDRQTPTTAIYTPEIKKGMPVDHTSGVKKPQSDPIFLHVKAKHDEYIAKAAVEGSAGGLGMLQSPLTHWKLHKLWNMMPKIKTRTYRCLKTQTPNGFQAAINGGFFVVSIRCGYLVGGMPKPTEGHEASAYRAQRVAQMSSFRPALILALAETRPKINRIRRPAFTPTKNIVSMTSR